MKNKTPWWIFFTALALVISVSSTLVSADTVPELSYVVYNENGVKTYLFSTIEEAKNGASYVYYLLNGVPVDVVQSSADGTFVQIKVCESTYWVESNSISTYAVRNAEAYALPWRVLIDAEFYVFGNPHPLHIPQGSTVLLKGYLGTNLVISYSDQLGVIPYSSVEPFAGGSVPPNTLLSKDKAIEIAIHEVSKNYCIPVDTLLQYKVKFLWYTQITTPISYTVVFEVTSSETYSVGIDAEKETVLYCDHSTNGKG